MELLFELVLSAFLVFFMVATAGLSTRTVTDDPLTAKGFPLIVAGAALLLLLFAAVQYVRECKRGGIKVFHDLRIPKKVLLAAGLLLSYILLVNRIGFVICTLVYSYGNARLLGYESRWKVGMFAVVLTIVFTAMFGTLFGVPLPRGTGVIREMTYYIY